MGYISVKQGVCLVALFIIGNAVIMNPGRDAGRDTWLSFILAILAAIPLYLIYAVIHSLYKGKTLFDIVEIVFGKFFGKIFILFYIWYAFFLSSLTLRNFGEFIITISLPETPLVVIIVSFGLLCLFAIKSGIGVLARYGELAITIIIAIILLTFIMSIAIMDINNLRPILSKGMLPVFKGGVAAFLFPFSEVIILSLSFSFFTDTKSAYKVFFWGLGLGGGTLLLSILNQISIVGADEFQSSYFPIYKAIGRINIGNFIQRIEIFVALVYLSAGFIKTSLCFMGTCLGIAKLFGYKDYKFIATPVCFLMFNLSLFVFQSIMELFNWTSTIWSYYAFPFQVAIPLIILIGVLIKNKGVKRRGVVNNG